MHAIILSIYARKQVPVLIFQTINVFAHQLKLCKLTRKKLVTLSE